MQPKDPVKGWGDVVLVIAVAVFLLAFAGAYFIWA